MRVCNGTREIKIYWPSTFPTHTVTVASWKAPHSIIGNKSDATFKSTFTNKFLSQDPLPPGSLPVCRYKSKKKYGLGPSYGTSQHNYFFPQDPFPLAVPRHQRSIGSNRLKSTLFHVVGLAQKFYWKEFSQSSAATTSKAFQQSASMPRKA